MGIISRFQKGVKKYMAEADQRAERRLARIKTKAGREKEEARIEKERLTTKREVSQAKMALLQAEAKRKKAAKEVKDIGGDVFSGLRNFLQPAKPKRRVKRGKAKKTVTRRR